jgi:hypothetical protein
MQYELSPRAQKAKFEAAARARAWWPSIARTASKAVVMRPSHGGRRHRQAFTAWMRVNLPAFSFDNKRNYWTAPLGELAAARETLAPVNLSDGAVQFLGGLSV